MKPSKRKTPRKRSPFQVDVQIVALERGVPSVSVFKAWVVQVLKETVEKAQLTLRIVDAEESQRLNETYRKKVGPTNVLAFPFLETENKAHYLGDIVICAPLVFEEAKVQEKSPEAHWAHLVVHGCLHLLGYDHVDAADANKMEACEIKILAELNFQNPYEHEEMIIHE